MDMNGEMENKEWLDDYMSLKQVNPVSPFSVPAGYFDDLDQRIKSAITLDGLKSANAEGGFTVPANYFDELQGNIQSRINIETIAASGATSFAVPDDYFDELQGNIQSRINIETIAGSESPNFAVPDNFFNELQSNIQSRINIETVAASGAASFAVPDDYFVDLEQQIKGRIFIEETLNAPTDGFDVPEGYFEKLNSKVLSQTVNAKAPQKSKGIVRKMYATGAFKYATAACFALVVGSVLFVNQFESPTAKHNRTYLHKALSNVADDDIVDYLQMHMDAADTRTVIDQADQIKSNDVTSDDIKDYLGTN